MDIGVRESVTASGYFLPLLCLIKRSSLLSMESNIVIISAKSSNY